MSQIEEITKVVKKDDSWYQLYFDSGRTLTLHEDVLVEHALFKGTQMTEQWISRVEQDNAQQVFFLRAVHYLQRQLRTEKEVRQYLLKQQCPESIVNNIIQRLIRLSFLDDREYAEAYVRTHMKLGKKGPIRVLNELLKKGVQETISQEALLQYTDTIEIDHIDKYIQKLAERYKQYPINEQKKKISQQLVSKGYHKMYIQQQLDNYDFCIDDALIQAQLEKQGNKYWQKYAKKTLYERRQRVKAMLYQKGFDTTMIQEFIEEKELYEE